MLVDYGLIYEYRHGNHTGKAGFGFVNHTIHKERASLNRVYFHIKQIKQKYPEVAQKLGRDFYQGVGFWYTFEETEKGEQVLDVWLQVDEMPPSTVQECINEISKIWGEIRSPLPYWIEKITIQLGGEKLLEQFQSDRHQKFEKRRLAEVALREKEDQLRKKMQAAEEVARLEQEIQRIKREFEEQERLRRKREAERIALENQRQAEIKARSDEIRQFCQQQGIQNLIHFTQIQNLKNILKKGLFSREELERIGGRDYIFNDPLRIDGCKDAVCLSISFPNYKMFYPYSQNNQATWVILLLDSAILWELDCAFCQENAASNNVRHISICERKKASSLKSLFLDVPPIQRKNLGIPSNYPTHPQAEVLVFNSIEPRYIKAVYFYTMEAQQKWQMESLTLFSPSCICDQRYFSARKDYPAWKSSSPSPRMTGIWEEETFTEVPSEYPPFDYSIFDAMPFPDDYE